ncbi:MAG: hypothetical protein KBD86_09285 [Candidatus Promineofilum sp.]|nr:hypothetical protein [Promineifilum sp.]
MPPEFPQNPTRETSIPPLEGGAPAPPPPFAPPIYRPPVTLAPSDAPAIHVWQGLTQYVSHNGDPQKWFNLLGNVAIPPQASIAALEYSFNGGPWLPLNIGPDDRRLAMPGDFNVELDYTDFLPGPNTVSLRATADNDAFAHVDVTLIYEERAAPWLPGTTHVYDWLTTTEVADLAQMVDGPWVLDGDSVRPGVFDFDRLLAIGDLTWRDYTVTVPITIYGIDPSGYQAPSNGPGIGLLVRWAGHYDADNGVSPVTGWRRLGALAWYRWSRKSGQYTEGLQMLGHRGQVLNTKARRLSIATTYQFRIDISSNAAAGAPATYRFKVWPAADPEPSSWDFVEQGVAGEPSGGSFLLLAHHVDARFGPVTVDLKSVRPLPTLNISGTGPGTVSLDPLGPDYRFGEDVTLTAVPASGGAFAGWTGMLADEPNPATMSLFESMSAGATFSGVTTISRPFFISSAAKGTTPDGVAFMPADILRYDPDGGWSLWFDASDVGITKNLAAFAILDSGDVLMSFSAAQPITGLGKVAPHDIVRFIPQSTGPDTSGTFLSELVGSTAGLTAGGEKIDALDVAEDGRILISTTGAAVVALPGGATQKAQDEDALAIDTASGAWSLWFDGTLLPGMKTRNLGGLWADATTDDLYVILPGKFNLSGVRGDGRDIIQLTSDGTGGYTPSLWWDGSAAGFPVNIDALHIDR